MQAMTFTNANTEWSVAFFLAREDDRAPLTVYAIHAAMRVMP